MARANLKEARNRLARASVCFEQAYEEVGEFSLAAERVRELLGDTRVWLLEYSEELGYLPSATMRE